MLFTSIEFAIFVVAVFFLYWVAINNNYKWQNTLLLVASYFFYGWWDWRLMLLLFALSLLNYFIGIKVEEKHTGRKSPPWLVIGVVINVGILVIFKYLNFFICSFVDFGDLLGYELSISTLKVILPVGISFYVFLGLSYIIDIYRGNLVAEKNIVNALLTFSFFPIILAGPIQRPVTLLPQISRPRRFELDQTKDGLKQILWGLFAKVVVADRLGVHVDNIFLNQSSFYGSTLLVGALFYSIQIYADFSGYSNIAIGTAKLFGFNLMRNFAYPYFVKDISEFWKKWHISLTEWFRDYIFLPLTFNLSLKIKWQKCLFIGKGVCIYIIASFVTWILTGLWHGSNYTFLLWGLIHGVSLLVFQIYKKNKRKILSKFTFTNNHPVIRVIETTSTLIIVVLAWVVFRSDNVANSAHYLNTIFSSSLFSIPQILPYTTILLSVFFLFYEWFQRKKIHPLEVGKAKTFRLVRWGFYYLLIVLIILNSDNNAAGFIYTQF